MKAVRARLDWFKETILPHEGTLRGRLRRILPAGFDIDDMVAECLARAFASGDTSRTGTGRAYLFQIARNLMIDEARRAKIISFEVIADLDLLQSTHSAEAELQARDELRRLQAILDSLPPQCRRVFIMRRVYGNSIVEIAEDLGLSVSTVDKHLARATLKIAYAIGQYEDSGFGWSLQKRGGKGSDRDRGGASLS